MARVPRGELLPDWGVFHVVTRGVAETWIYGDDVDRRYFLGLLAGVVHRFQLECQVFCLMNTHYHVVLVGARVNLSTALHRLNGRYATQYNKRYRRRGHLFADRFSSWLIESEEHFAATVRYVLANPVRAGLCDDPATWRWSGSRYGHDVW
jgi:REP-associated tyrosine transposase